jgi:hypothetical protein
MVRDIHPIEVVIVRKGFRITLWILAGFTIVLAGAFFYLKKADLSAYEEQIEGLLSDAVGHKVDVDGLFEFNFGKHTHLVAEQIRVSNPDWPSAPILLSVEHFSVTVNLWSVFKGPIFIENLNIQGIDFRLEKDEQGAMNWQSGVPETEDEDTQSGSFNTNLFVFKDVRIDDFQFSFMSPDRTQALIAALDYLTVNPGDNDILDLDLRGAVNEIPLWADGKIGPLQNLVNGRDISANLEMTLGQLKLSIDGSIDDPTELSGIETQFEISGPAIEHIIEVLEIPPFAAGPYLLAASVQGANGGNEFRVKGNLGEIEIFSSGNIDNFIGADRAQLDFRFAGPDTSHLAEVFGINGAPAAPFQVSGDFEMTGSVYQFSETEARIGDNVLSLDGMLDKSQPIPDLDITVGASGPDFSVIGPFAGIADLPADAFDIHGRIKKSDKRWLFDDFKAVIGKNNFAANGSIGDDGIDDAEISVSASGPNNLFIQSITGLDGFPPKPYAISARIRPDPVGIKIEGATAIFGDNKIRIDGVVPIDGGLSGTRLTVGLSGADLSRIAALASTPDLPAGPYQINAGIRLTDKSLLLDNVSATVGDLRAAANGQVGMGSESGKFDVTLSLEGPDVAVLIEHEVLQRLSGEAFKVGGRVKSEPDAFGLTAVSIAIGSLRVAIDGNLARSLESAKITLDVSSPDSLVLSKLLGLNDMPAGAVSVRGKIEKQADYVKFTETNANLGEFVFSLNGTLSSAPLSNNSDLSFHASGADMHQLGLPFGFGGLPTKSFSVTGGVVGVPTGFAVDKLVAQIGDNSIDGEFRVDLGDKPEITGRLASSYIDLTHALLDAEPKAAETEGKYLFSDEALELDGLQKANIDITIQTGRLISRFGDFLDFQLGLRIWDGALDMQPFMFRQTEGSFSASLQLQPTATSHSITFAANMKNARIGLMASEHQDPATMPASEGRIHFIGTGNSLHEIMASSNGHASIYQGAGQIKSASAGGSRLFGDIIMQTLNLINPTYKRSPHVNLECAIVEVDIKNGVASTEALAIQSVKMTVISRGKIDFNTEKLNFKIQTTPREGFGISLGGVINSFIKLGGTLKAPAIGIDPESSTVTTGIAVATAGLSLLAKGMWDRAGAEKSICEQPEK